MEKKIWTYIIICTCIIIYPLTMRVIGAPQMISQLVSPIFPCSPLPFGTWRTPGLSIPWCCPLKSSSVCLVFFPLFTVPCKMVLARPDELETCPYHCSLHLFTIVMRSSCDPIACWILAWISSLVTWSFMKCVVFCGSTSFLWLVFSNGALLWGSMIHKHTGRWMWQGCASVLLFYYIHDAWYSDSDTITIMQFYWIIPRVIHAPSDWLTDADMYHSV